MQLFGYDVLSFEGRMNRKPFILIPIVLNLIAYVIYHFISADSTVGGIINIVFTLIGASFYVRRMHDTDKSAWWLLVLCIPIIGWVFSIYLMCAKGTSGPNDYGPDPLAGKN